MRVSTATTFRKYKQYENNKPLYRKRQYSTKMTPTYLIPGQNSSSKTEIIKVQSLNPENFENNNSDYFFMLSNTQNETEANKKKPQNNIHSRNKIQQMNKKCRQMRTQNYHHCDTNPGPKALKIFVDYQSEQIKKQQILKNKRSPSSFSSPKTCRSSRVKQNHLDLLRLEEIITTLSSTPAHHSERSDLIRSLSSHREPTTKKQTKISNKSNKYCQQNRHSQTQQNNASKHFRQNYNNIHSNTTFRTSMKPKNITDNPNVFVNILKRKMLVMETNDIQKYLIKMAKQMNS